MQTILAAIVILGLGVFGMCFNIIFRKNGEFPETEVSKNKEMKKRGIKCMREQEDEMFGKKSCKDNVACNAANGGSCASCSLYTENSKK